jgi:hypothetical protein
MRLLLVLSLATFLRICSSDVPEAPPPSTTAAVVAVPPAPPVSTPVTVDSPPPALPAVAAVGTATGVGVTGSAEVRFVQSGPREVRLYGLRQGRRLRATDLRVRRAWVLLPEGPSVIVLEPREDYYVAVTPFDLPPAPRFDVEVGYVADPQPPSIVVVDGFAPRASVEVAAFVPAPPVVGVVAPAPPDVAFVAPAPPAVHVRGGVSVDAKVVVPATRVVVVPPRPPSISIGIGVPSPRVVVVGEVHGDPHHGRGVGHVRARGRGHHRH